MPWMSDDIYQDKEGAYLSHPPTQMERFLYSVDENISYINAAFLIVSFLVFIYVLRKKLIKRADTSIKRSGIVLLIMAAFIYLITAMHWNLTKRNPFIYRYQYTVTEKIPLPTDTPEYTYWEETYNSEISAYGWMLYDKPCVEKKKSQQRWFLFSLKECETKFIPYPLHVKYRLSQSFDDYIESLFNKGKDYFYLNIVAIAIMLLGLSMFLGIASRLLKWIKEGK